MKSNVKLLIIGAVVIVLLAAAVVLLGRMSGEDTEEQPEETTAAEVLSRLLYDKDPTLIDNIHVKNASGEYDIKKFGEGSWLVADLAGVPHSAAALQGICGAAATLTSQQTASENAEDLSVYGLAQPSAEVTVSFSGGSDVKELLIGSDAPDGNLTYVCFKGGNTVYAVKTKDVDVYRNDKFSFIAKTVYTPAQGAADEVEELNKVKKLTVSRKDTDYDIVLEYDIRQDDPDAIYGNSSTHIMKEPVVLGLDPDKVYDVINNVFNLTADGIAVIGPSEDTRADFGINDPFCEVSYVIPGGDFRLMIGNEYAGSEGVPEGRYCYADGIDIIYKFGYGKLPWLNIDPVNISMPLIIDTYIYAIDTLEIAGGGQSTLFRLSGTGNDFTVDCGDPDVTGDTFKDFYQYVLKAPADELCLEPCTDPADVTMTITHTYGTDKLEFVNSADRQTIIRLNGRTSYKCRTSYVNRLLENLERLLNGEPIIQNW